MEGGCDTIVMGWDENPSFVLHRVSTTQTKHSVLHMALRHIIVIALGTTGLLLREEKANFGGQVYRCQGVWDKIQDCDPPPIPEAYQQQ